MIVALAEAHEAVTGVSAIIEAASVYADTARRFLGAGAADRRHPAPIRDGGRAEDLV